jgi:hypothetical protein
MRSAFLAVMFAAGVAGPIYSGTARLTQQSSKRARLDAVTAAVPSACDLSDWVAGGEEQPGLASWQTVAGCGAGSATGIGGIKWIGRNVRGGLMNLQCQANHTRFEDGYSYTVNNQITSELSEDWVVGVVIPYLYKWIDDPLELGWDLSNQGLGDVNLMVTRRLGPINATSITASVGLPTGTSDAGFQLYKLPQDRQLGAGKFSGALLVDHTLDNLWGPVVIGGSASYPGGANALENYRAPSTSAYAYAGYLLGAFVPALGASATAFYGQDRDRGLPNQDRPPFMAALNASLEWSSDWLALLVGASVPFAKEGLQPWTAGVGLSLAPF